MWQIGDDTGALINAFICEAQAVASLLAEREGLPIECVHIENALVEVLGLDDSTELLFVGLTKGGILSALGKYDFQRLFPQLIAEVRFENSIIPSGVARALVEQTVRCNGEVWRIHRNDSDPFPSSPHGHNLESGHKLHLGTGELFLRRQAVGKIEKKHLLAIRGQLSTFVLPRLAC
jgi:hypothetical protein